MKSCSAVSVFLMLLFFQCSMNLPKEPAATPRSNALFNLEANQLINPEQMATFLMKLHQLKSEGVDSVLKIIHIGDSHIQMGYFPGEVRNALQARFGGEGIGFFFPNSLCSGFNPIGLDISSSSNWQCEKITNMESVIPLGIIGMGMKTEDKESEINVSLKGKNNLVSSFRIFHQNFSQTHEIACENATIATHNFSDHSAISTITMQTEVDVATVKFTAKTSATSPLIVYGLSVNSPAKKGIDFNTFGVSGGQYKYFANNTPLLVEHLSVLKPDLIIISLGSNDSYVKSLEKDSYKRLIRDFVETMRKASPSTAFILTTPPDTRLKDSKPVSGHVVNQSIVEIGKESNCTVWDFYTIMGGYGSVNKWKKKKLGNKDGLHLTMEGYYLQGQLFNLAMARAMEQKFPGNGWLAEAERMLVKSLQK